MKGRADRIALGLASLAAAIYVLAAVLGKLARLSGHAQSWSIPPVAEFLLVLFLAAAITVAALVREARRASAKVHPSQADTEAARKSVKLEENDEQTPITG